MCYVPYKYVCVSHTSVQSNSSYVCGIKNSSWFVYAYVHLVEHYATVLLLWNLCQFSHSFVFDERGYIHLHPTCPECKNTIHKGIMNNQSIWCAHSSLCDSAANYITISNNFLFWKPTRGGDIPEASENSPALKNGGQPMYIDVSGKSNIFFVILVEIFFFCIVYFGQFEEICNFEIACKK